MAKAENIVSVVMMVVKAIVILMLEKHLATDDLD